MPTNFPFLKIDPQFVSFADIAEQAELVLPINPALTARDFILECGEGSVCRYYG